MTFAIRWENAI